jgi:hypothetical protein
LAGLGRKEFNSGDILLASEVQGYLQDQAVMVFDDATARGSAIPSPSEGMLTYNKDTDQLELYDGSAFGPVGSDSGLIHIDTIDIGSGVSAVSVDNVFTSTFTNYKIIFDTFGMSNTATAFLNFKLRLSGTDNSDNQYGRQGYSSAGSLTNLTGKDTFFTVNQLRTGTSFRSFHILEILKPQKAAATNFIVSNYNDDATTTFGRNFQGIHEVNTAFDGFSYLLSTGNMTGGKIRLYGYKD